MNKQIKISLSNRCLKAYEYLKKYKVNANIYLRAGGEIAVINKANELYYQEKKEKEFPNAPTWLFKNQINEKTNTNSLSDFIA